MESTIFHRDELKGRLSTNCKFVTVIEQTQVCDKSSHVKISQQILCKMTEEDKNNKRKELRNALQKINTKLVLCLVASTNQNQQQTFRRTPVCHSVPLRTISCRCCAQKKCRHPSVRSTPPPEPHTNIRSNQSKNRSRRFI